MVKFVAEDENGVTIIGLGISESNLRKMQMDKSALTVNLKEDMGVNFDAKIFIFIGETEAAMAAMLQPLISEKTKIVSDYK